MNLLSFLLFQASWWVAILAGAAGHSWPGVLAVLAHGGILLWRRPALRQEWRFWLATLALGAMLDSLLATLGVLSFPHPWLAEWLSPPYMVALWLNLALTLPLSLKWLNQRYLLAAIFGALGGPLAYLGGQQLGAVQLAVPLFPNLLLLAVYWLLAMPLLLLMRQQLVPTPSPSKVTP